MIQVELGWSDGVLGSHFLFFLVTFWVPIVIYSYIVEVIHAFLDIISTILARHHFSIQT